MAAGLNQWWPDKAKWPSEINREHRVKTHTYKPGSPHQTLP